MPMPRMGRSERRWILRRHRHRRRWCSVLVGLLGMLLMSSSRLFLPVRCGWIARQPYGRISQFGGRHSSGFRNDVPTFRSSASRLFAQWNVGDAVAVQVQNDLVQGIVHEKRGAGWYTVRLVADDETNVNVNVTTGHSIVKCRSTQIMKRDSENTTTITTTTTTTTTTISEVPMFSAPSTERPVIHPDSGVKPEFPSPPPTIHDLDAALLDRSNISNPLDQQYLQQVHHHAQYETWVVFTDLHCSPASLETCLQVLRRVHELAVQRENAGILFLGDFWHHRGTLRVDCLNAVLEELSTWTVPMIMIPGNHDQITLDGHHHSLTPLQNAYRVGNNVSGPLIFSYPTKFREALFVPHIRDVATMESILQSSYAQDSSSSSALFVHADVTGALMNDLMVSLQGIPPASFPVHKRIYSGHFHKPHTVKAAGDKIQIEYLGSPYETSLSEAQQAKTLAILDSQWNIMEYVPIDIGRRHFKVSSWKELAEFQFPNHQEDKHPPPPSSSAVSVEPTTVRSGDRIVASIPQSEMEGLDSNLKSHIQTLRSGGAMVEIRELKSLPEQALGSTLVGGGAEQLEELTPESTWRAYIDEEETQRQSLPDRDAAKRLLEAGLEIIREVETSQQIQAAPATPVTDFSLTQVSMEGFGPFQKKVIYPLLNRGLVLLRGTNHDVGSDSNGSGKSSLAMAALWALTGSMDPRRAQDGKVSDVINDNAKTARVTLDGTLNGDVFTISRSKTASKTQLVFHLNGVDLTTQSVKETQALIEEHLGVSVPILSRTMFHGQHSINDLLEATDAKLKEELALLVPLGLWQTAASLARAKSREASKRMSEYEGMISMREQDLNRLSMKQTQAERDVNQKLAAIAGLEAEYGKRFSSNGPKTSETNFTELEGLLHDIPSEVRRLEAEYERTKVQKEAALEPLQAKLRHASSDYDSAMRLVQNAELSLFGAKLNLKTALETIKDLEQKWSIKTDEESISDLVVPDACPTCGQPIRGDGDGHSHENIELKLASEINQTIAKRNEAQRKFDAASKELEDQQSYLGKKKEEVAFVENELKRAEAKWDNELGNLQKMMDDKGAERNRVSEQMANAARQSQISAKREAAVADINMEKASLNYANQSLLNVNKELEEVQTRLSDMRAESEDQEKQARTMTELADRFGQRGVQTYVLQHVVDVLQMCSQTYLDDLSDGSQRMELSLDAGDRISRTAFVVGADGTYKERPLATLSGGQWRRCSIALTFGFAELVARRGKFRPSMCVLDEPFTHLDRSGRSRVGDVIRKLLRPSETDGMKGFGINGMSTVILILQDLAAEELDEAFDCIDEVVKENSVSHVKIDGFQRD